MKKKILLYAANNQSLENVRSSLEFISDDAEYYWLDLSNIFHQTLQKPLSSCHQLTLDISLNTSFYHLNEFRKVLFLLRLKHSRVVPEWFDLIILGDMGIVEYQIFKYFYFGKKVFIQDAILLWSEIYSWKKRMRSFFYKGNRLSLCDKIICSGLVTKQTLVKDGVKEEKISAIGIPRFNKYFKRDVDIKDRNSIPVFLFIGEAYSWHGHSRMNQEQYHILKALDEMQGENRDKFEIKYRKHPREFGGFTPKNIHVIDPELNSLNDNLIESDFLINYGFPSTVLFEAACLGIKTIFCKSTLVKYDQMTMYDEFSSLTHICDKDSFHDTLIFASALNSDIKSDLLAKFINKDRDYFALLSDVLNSKG